MDLAVEHEFKRTCVTRRILPIHRVDPHLTTVSQDLILSSVNGAPISNLTGVFAFGGGALIAGAAAAQASLMPNIDEAATTRLIELWVEFSATAQQIEYENSFKPAAHEPTEEPAEQRVHHGHLKRHAYSTLVSLATRAANILSLAVDSVVFKGQIATGGTTLAPNGEPLFTTVPGFTSALVQNRGVPSDFGLLCLGPSGQNLTANLSLPATQVVAVPSSAPPAPLTNTVQFITISGATAGTQLQLSYGGNTSAAFGWVNSNATLVGLVTTALTSAPINIPAAQVAVSPASLTNGIGTIQVTFLGALATTATAITANVSTAPGTVATGVPARYVENTVRAHATAYALLEGAGHIAPFASIIHYSAFADAAAPLPTTLILPADRIREVMEEGFVGSGSHPGVPNPINPPPVGLLAAYNPVNSTTQSMGLVLAPSANNMDLVIGQEPITAFSQVDQNGNHVFRVLTRFCVRLKDSSSVIRLEFQ